MLRQTRSKTLTVVCSLLWAAAGLALGAASWPGQPYMLAVAEPLTACGQVRTGALAMMLNHDTPCSIGVSVVVGGDEVLTSAGDSLVTGYKLTGTALQNGDADWVDSSTFLTRVYQVQGTGPADEITIWVRAAAASGRANNPGVYSAAIVLTASW